MNVYYFRNKNHIRLVEHLGTFRNKYQLVPIYHFRNRYLDGQKIIIKPDGHFMLVGGLEHFFMFPYIGNFIIPTDFHMFQRGRYPVCDLWDFDFLLGDHVFSPYSNGTWGIWGSQDHHGYSNGFGNLKKCCWFQQMTMFLKNGFLKHQAVDCWNISPCSLVSQVQ